VAPTTEHVIHTLHPEQPGHMKNDQASVSPLIAAAAVRFLGQVTSHFSAQGSEFTTGGVTDASQPAHAAARNLDSELLCAIPPGTGQRAGRHSHHTPPRRPAPRPLSTVVGRGVQQR
jgi:hypothetical protein